MTLTLQPPRVPLVDQNGQTTKEWYRYFLDLQQRVGGYDSASLADLSESTFEDAGIEEAKAGLYLLRDDLMTAPRSELVAAVEFLQTQVAELAALVTTLQGQIQDLNQG